MLGEIWNVQNKHTFRFRALCLHTQYTSENESSATNPPFQVQ